MKFFLRLCLEVLDIKAVKTENCSYFTVRGEMAVLNPSLLSADRASPSTVRVKPAVAVDSSQHVLLSLQAPGAVCCSLYEEAPQLCVSAGMT